MAGNDYGKKREKLSRRGFLQGATAAGAGLVWAGRAAGAAGSSGGDHLNLALIGCGSQGRVLLTDCLKVPGVRFKAVCDIWDYHKSYAANILKAYKQDVNVYTDYREMLASAHDLDAAIIATPDWVHAEQTIACLNAGLHVYCEKEMSNSLAEARNMVRAARETGHLLQIGHQRRSNPRYLHAENMIYKEGMLGRMTHAQGQWHRARQQPRGWPKGKPLEKARLKEYGYHTMERLRNWRWYRKFSGGPMADLGSHQVDIFNWWLRAHPKSVQAKGGTGYYPDWEWWDSVLALYEYETPQGTVIAEYQVLNTTSFGGFYEVFMGDEGSLKISEMSDIGHIYREPVAKKKTWEDEASKVEKMGRKAIALKVGESREWRLLFEARWADVYGSSNEPSVSQALKKLCKNHGVELSEKAALEKEIDAGWVVKDEDIHYLVQKKEGKLKFHQEKQVSRGKAMGAQAKKPVHTYHLENFFNAIRGEAQLTCPAEEAYATAVSVLKANQAVEAGKEVTFKPAEFTV